MFTSLKKTALLAAGLLATCSAMAAPTLIYSSGGSSYYLSERAGAWTDVEAQAVAFGGHLVTINDAAEQAELSQHFGTSQRLWIGLNDAAVEGQFVWASGELSNYTNWYGGEPNNWQNLEDYVAMNWLGGSSAWNDLPNGGYGTLTALTPAFGIIEVHDVPEPGVLGLASAGLLGLFAARRRRTTLA